LSGILTVHLEVLHVMLSVPIVYFSAQNIVAFLLTLLSPNLPSCLCSWVYIPTTTHLSWEKIHLFCHHHHLLFLMVLLLLL